MEMVIVYCFNCGERLDEGVTRCPKCGTYVSSNSKDYSVILGVFAILLGILLAPIAWFCGFIGLTHAYKYNNTLGKIINYIALFIGTMVFLFYIIILSSTGSCA